MSPPESETDVSTISRFMLHNQDVPRFEGRYDLELFRELNAAYANRPVVKEPRSLDAAERRSYAKSRAELLERRVRIRGKRVLEIGCGAGDLSRELAEGYGARVVGVDIAEYPVWKDLSSSRLRLLQGDLADAGFAERVAAEGPFDRIVSLVVWEHVKHPHALLAAAHRLLSKRGRFYLRANLYRSSVASHLYREVYFPWAHLLFEDEVFRRFYESIGLPPQTPAWLNKLCYAHYLLYFREIGFDMTREWLTRRPLDRELYDRFAERLSRYPVFDLTLEFFDVILMRASAGPLGVTRSAGRQLVKGLLERGSALRIRRRRKPAG